MSQINIEELKAELKAGYNKVVRHKDGGFYTTLFLSKVKQADGSWADSVNYTQYPNKNGDLFTRSLENFAERFTQVNGENILMFDIPAVKDFTTAHNAIDIKNIIIEKNLYLGCGVGNGAGSAYQYEIIEEPGWETPVLKIYTEDSELLEAASKWGDLDNLIKYVTGTMIKREGKYCYTDISEILIRL